jgi:hypothetical protein
MQVKIRPTNLLLLEYADLELDSKSTPPKFILIKQFTKVLSELTIHLQRFMKVNSPGFFLIVAKLVAALCYKLKLAGSIPDVVTGFFN